MVTNDFIPFCPTDTGTNLLSQSDYIAASDRTDGNQPGVASSKLNNKALRQGTFVASQLAQYVSDFLTANVSDDGNTAEFLSQMKAALKPLVPNVSEYTSGSSTWNMQYQFFIAAGNATATATYTNNGVTFTVVSTVAAGTLVKMTGNGDPTVSGTLTKATGTGDATLTFYAFRKPLYLIVDVVGGGGGGGSSGTTGGGGQTSGGTSSFGGTIISCTGGNNGTSNGTGTPVTGGSASTTAPAVVLIGLNGAGGTPGGTNNGAGTAEPTGGPGGASFLGGNGAGSGNTDAGSAASNSGSGGGGAGISNVASGGAGGGGGSGAFVRAQIPAPASTYAIVVGAAGGGGSAGSSGHNGGAGAAGLVVVTEYYQ